MLAFVRRMNTEPVGALRRAPLGAGAWAAVYVVDAVAVRGSIGRLDIYGHQYIVDRTSEGFRPLFNEDI